MELTHLTDDPQQMTLPRMLKEEGYQTGIVGKWHHGHDCSIVNGISRIGFMKGGESGRWIDEDMADTFLARAQEYVAETVDEPFFLY